MGDCCTKHDDVDDDVDDDDDDDDNEDENGRRLVQTRPRFLKGRLALIQD